VGVRNKFTQELKQTILDTMHTPNDGDLFGFVRNTDCDADCGLALPPVSLSGQIDHAVEVIIRRELSGRPQCARSGRLSSAMRTDHIRPFAALPRLSRYVKRAPKSDIDHGWRLSQRGS